MKKRIIAAIMTAAMAVLTCVTPVSARTETESAGLTLAGRTCVIEGGTGSIGHDAVLMMAEKGMNVVLITHNPASAEEIVNEAAGLPGVVTAMSNEASMEDLLTDIEEEFGSVDVYINKTGSKDAPSDLEDLSAETLQGKLDNVVGIFEKVQVAIPFLERSEHGRLILTSCAGSMDGNSYESFYDELACGAINSMVYALAQMLSGTSVTVNGISMSGIINDHDGEEGALDVADYEDMIPAGHAGTSQEYGGLLVYLVSEEADFMTGSVLNLTGGLYIG